MANLWQELKGSSGVQCTNGKGDEKGEHILHIVRLHDRHDGDSSEGAGTDHCHTQERKAPHWWFESQGGWMEKEGLTLQTIPCAVLNTVIQFFYTMHNYANYNKSCQKCFSSLSYVKMQANTIAFFFSFIHQHRV